MREETRRGSSQFSLQKVHRPLMFGFALIGLLMWNLGMITAADSAALSAFMGVTIVALD